MGKKLIQKSARLWTSAAGAILLVIAPVIAGCSIQGYGYLKRSREVTLAFKANRIFADYRYYYRGRRSRPYAIAGIQNSYELKPGSWKEIDLTETRLDKLIDRMEIRYGYSAHGAKILDPTGKQVGVWYSSLEWALVKMEKESRIIFLSPEVRQIEGSR